MDYGKTSITSEDGQQDFIFQDSEILTVKSGIISGGSFGNQGGGRQQKRLE